MKCSKEAHILQNLYIRNARNGVVVATKIFPYFTTLALVRSGNAAALWWWKKYIQSREYTFGIFFSFLEALSDIRLYENYQPISLVFFFWLKKFFRYAWTIVGCETRDFNNRSNGPWVLLMNDYLPTLESGFRANFFLWSEWSFFCWAFFSIIIIWTLYRYEFWWFTKKYPFFFFFCEFSNYTVDCVQPHSAIPVGPETLFVDSSAN